MLGFYRIEALAVRYFYSDQPTRERRTPTDHLLVLATDPDEELLWEFSEYNGVVGDYFKKLLPEGAIITSWYLQIVDIYDCCYFAEFFNNITFIHTGLWTAEGSKSIISKFFLEVMPNELLDFMWENRPTNLDKVGESVPRTLLAYLSLGDSVLDIITHKKRDYVETVGAWIARTMKKMGLELSDVARIGGLDLVELEDYLSGHKPLLPTFPFPAIQENPFPRHIADGLKKVCSWWNDWWLYDQVENYKEKSMTGKYRIVTYEDVVGS